MIKKNCLMCRRTNKIFGAFLLFSLINYLYNKLILFILSYIDPLEQKSVKCYFYNAIQCITF